VVACNDDRGLQVLDACRRAGLRVPDEVAVVGVDNDALVCNLSSPPLSSVDTGVERAGYAAAELLERMMAGEKVRPEPVFLQPVGVVARRSTEVTALADAELAGLIRHVRDHACDGLRVGDLVKRSSRSQSTPQEEIARVRLDRARHLLAHTDLSVAAVAGRCGFAHAKHFCTAFLQGTGQTPGQFRRATRYGSADE
jgi:LacI family transcriptional regulator